MERPLAVCGLVWSSLGGVGVGRGGPLLAELGPRVQEPSSLCLPGPWCGPPLKAPPPVFGPVEGMLISRDGALVEEEGS